MNNMQTVQTLLETNKENNSKKRNKLRESKEEEVTSKIVRAPRSPDRRPSTGASAQKETPEIDTINPSAGQKLEKQDSTLE